VPRLTKRISINASADKVWGVLADFGGVAKWAPTVVESHLTTEANGGVGAKRMLAVSTGESVEEVVVEWNEGRSFTFQIPAGLASVVKMLQETWTVEPALKESVVAVTMDYTMKYGIIGTALDSLMVGRALRKMLAQNLAGLKHHIETGEAKG
jgi:carbon monoxide dehydrogenase subunit G